MKTKINTSMKLSAKKFIVTLIASLVAVSIGACRTPDKGTSSSSIDDLSNIDEISQISDESTIQESQDGSIPQSSTGGTGNSSGVISKSSTGTNTSSAVVIPTKITPQTCTLTFACIDVASEKTIANAIIKAFNKVYPNVTVNLTPINGDYNAKILAQAVSKSLPDVMFTFDTITRVFAQNKILIPIDSYLGTFGYDKNNYFGNIMDLGKGDDGKIYMIPREYSHLVTAVNLSVIEAEENMSGAEFITKYKNWTMNDFITLSKKYTHIDGGGKVIQYGADINYNWEPVWTSFALGYGGSLINSSKAATFSNTNTVTGLSTMLDLVKGKYAYDNLRPESANPYPFNKGMAAFTFISRPAIPGINTAISGMGMKWDVLPFPTTPNKPVVGMGTTGYGVSANTKYPYEAALFAYFVATSEGQTAFIGTGSGVPVIKSLKDSAVWRNFPVPNKNSDAYVVNPQNDVRCEFSFSFNIKKITTFSNTLNDSMLKYLVGETSLADAMKTLDSVLNG